MIEQSRTRRISSVLRAEHELISRLMAVLQRLVDRSERGGGFARETFGECVEFFRSFADECHHAKEEGLLFPALEWRGIPRAGGPIGVMLHEHEMARGFTRDMARALEAHDADDPDAKERFCAAAGQYIELLTNHIAKEDNILFNMADQVLTESDQTSLCGKLCEMGCHAFRGPRHMELERMVVALEQEWLA